jgi:hypothetical protein
VDGVANKQVDDAWVAAPAAEKAARFASAEAIRWLEWGARSYQDFARGLALLLLAVAVVRTAWVARPIAYLMGLSGLTYLVQGWVVGSEGFSGTHTILILLAWALSLAWMIWLILIAWRMQDPQAAAWPMKASAAPPPRRRRSHTADRWCPCTPVSPATCCTSTALQHFLRRLFGLAKRDATRSARRLQSLQPPGWSCQPRRCWPQATWPTAWGTACTVTGAPGRIPWW